MHMPTNLRTAWPGTRASKSLETQFLSMCARLVGHKPVATILTSLGFALERRLIVVTVDDWHR